TVNFATYVYWTGSIAPEFAEALAERAEAGVEVNVLLDAVGGAKMDRTLIDRLQDSGAKVAWFRPPKWYTLHKLNNRTHRKILVVDGRVGFPGGVGIAEEWTGNCEDPGHWRDTHVRVEGPAARDLLGGVPDHSAEAPPGILSRPPRPPRGVPGQLGRGPPVHPVRPRPPARRPGLRRRHPGAGDPEHGREGLDRRRASVLRGHRLRPGADLADHRLLRPPAGVRGGPLRCRRAGGRRAGADQRPPHRQ